MAVVRSRLASVISANLLFTLMHVIFQNPPYNLPALIIVFLIGLFYTKCYLDRGLESAVACHAIMNLLVMTLGALL